MASSRTRRASMEQLQLDIDNQQGSQYACDCGQDFFDENYLKSHQQNNCANRQIKCSFCNEKFSSNEKLKTHFMACGNKTEQCPNCRQFIRRSHFAYHYENQCAPIDKIETPPIPPRNPLNQRIQLNPNKPIARTDVPSDDSTISNVRYQLQTPNMYNPSAIYQCDFCHEKCTKKDWEMHRENCLKNPKNSNSSVRNPTVSTKSNGISHIPCEFCDQQIDLPNWSKHSQDCREKYKREYEERARSMSREPVNENLPCENCHKLIPAAQLYNHRCSPARVGTQYEVIDYDRTRQANQGVPRRTGTNERLIQPNNSLPRQNERRSPDNFERQRSRNDIPQRGQSTHKLRRGHNSFEIIDNREGQSVIKRKKPPLWKRLCCVAKGDTND